MKTEIINKSFIAAVFFMSNYFSARVEKFRSPSKSLLDRVSCAKSFSYYRHLITQLMLTNKMPCISFMHTCQDGNSNNSIRFFEGSSRSICLPPTPSTISFLNFAPCFLKSSTAATIFFTCN